ncbi:MAG: replication-relaxation family protein [Rhizomicrobium sp.]
MKRTRTGKRIELTERDIAIFRLLSQYRYLRSTYIHAFVGGASETRFKERLGDLFHEGYLDRPPQQWEFADARHVPAVHELGERGRRALNECAGCEDDARTYLANHAHRQFQHGLMICECLASIELATRNRTGPRFIPWGEILAKAPAEMQAAAVPFKLTMPGGAMIPDAIFGLEYQVDGRKTYRFFALEADRGTMPVSRAGTGQTSYLAKLALYRQAIEGGHPKRYWNVPNLLVLTITTDPARLADILAKLDGEHPLFLFKAASQRGLAVPMAGLLAEPWGRAGLPPFRIDA